VAGDGGREGAVVAVAGGWMAMEKQRERHPAASRPPPPPAASLPPFRALLCLFSTRLDIDFTLTPPHDAKITVWRQTNGSRQPKGLGHTTRSGRKNSPEMLNNYSPITKNARPVFRTDMDCLGLVLNFAGSLLLLGK